MKKTPIINKTKTKQKRCYGHQLGKRGGTWAAKAPFCVYMVIAMSDKIITGLFFYCYSVLDDSKSRKQIPEHAHDRSFTSCV